MPKYLIEQELPDACQLGAEALGAEALAELAQKCELGLEPRWLRCGGFPARASEVIDPSTTE